MGVIPPLLQSQANLYGWIFLILGLLPLIGLIVVASRNLDALTEVIFSSTSRVAVGSVSQTDAAASSATCPKCSATIPAGAKFCGSCGAPVPIPVSTEVFCPGCGTKNEGGAKFCKSCGKPVIA
jgi:membrane protease subunit (stomatin/prohibitin family)